MVVRGMWRCDGFGSGGPVGTEKVVVMVVSDGWKWEGEEATEWMCFFSRDERTLYDYEDVSVRRMVGWSDGRMVRNLFFFLTEIIRVVQILLCYVGLHA